MTYIKQKTFSIICLVFIFIICSILGYIGANYFDHTIFGKYEYRPILIIDTLNIAHTKYEHLDIEKINNVIEISSKKLSKRFDKIIYVVKSKESASKKDKINDRKNYSELSKKLEVEIHLVEKLLKKSNNINQTHSSLGRDDFYIIHLSRKEHALVLSNDKFKDLKNMKTGDLDAFFVSIYKPFKQYETKDYIDPQSPIYAKLHKPKYYHAIISEILT